MWVLGLAACGSGTTDQPRIEPPVGAAAVARDAATADAALVPLADGVWKRGELIASDQGCVVRADGRVACWGANNYGEVGDEPRTPHPVPILVPGVAHAIAVAGGPGTTCAVLADGHLACWGAYDEKAAAPHVVAGIDNVAEVAVLSQRVCARKRDGDVWCWLPKKQPAPVAELGRARRLVAGFGSACVIGDDDRTHCIAWWAGKESTEAYQVLDIADAAGAVQIAEYYNTACAVLRDGRETCWTITDNSGPPALAVVPVPGVNTAIDVAGTNTEMCIAYRDGGARCSTAGTNARDAPWAREYRSIAAGPSSHCGVHPAGDVVCWGSDYGTLGRHSQLGAQPTPIDIAKVGDAEQLALEDDRACALRANGIVTCWDGPTAVDMTLSHVSKLRAGHRFTCGQIGGKTSCWGTKTWQQCRRRSKDNCQLDPFTNPSENIEPLAIPNAVVLADPCAIDATEHVKCRYTPASLLDVTGVEHAISATPHCAVSKSGAVACWPMFDGKTTALAATPVGGITDAVQVVSGTAHNCARTRAGEVACWGKNRLGQLGDGTRTARTAATKIAGLANVVELAAGNDFTCARTTAGAVSCWGANASGAIGDGSGRDQLAPVRIAIDDAVELAANGLHACARRKNRRVACWGHWQVNLVAVEQRVTLPEPESIE